MHFLFWLLWAINLLFAALSVVGGLFRDSLQVQQAFTNIHFWGLTLGTLAVLGGPVLRFALKMPRAALALEVLPLLVILVFYLLDR